MMRVSRSTHGSAWTSMVFQTNTALPPGVKTRSSSRQVACASTQCHACAQNTASMDPEATERKSTRLNSSHVAISYAVFCLTKKKLESEAHKRMVIRLPGDTLETLRSGQASS